MQSNSAKPLFSNGYNELIMNGQFVSIATAAINSFWFFTLHVLLLNWKNHLSNFEINWFCDFFFRLPFSFLSERTCNFWNGKGPTSWNKKKTNKKTGAINEWPGIRNVIGISSNFFLLMYWMNASSLFHAEYLIHILASDQN